MIYRGKVTLLNCPSTFLKNLFYFFTPAAAVNTIFIYVSNKTPILYFFPVLRLTCANSNKPVGTLRVLNSRINTRNLNQVVVVKHPNYSQNPHKTVTRINRVRVQSSVDDLFIPRSDDPIIGMCLLFFVQGSSCYAIHVRVCA